VLGADPEQVLVAIDGDRVPVPVAVDGHDDRRSLALAEGRDDLGRDAEAGRGLAGRLERRLELHRPSMAAFTPTG
jgi:hypothetical protein